jgi:hypothetical protein
MNRFALMTDASVRGGLFRRTFELTGGTRQRQSQRHVPAILAALDEQAGCDRHYSSSRRSSSGRQALHAAL